MGIHVRTHVQLGRNRRILHPKPVSVIPPAIRQEALWFQSLRGMGDNIFQRPYVYEFCKEYNRVYIDTPWPHFYCDMPDNLIFLRNKTRLRTQVKNIEKYCSGFPLFPPEAYDSIRSSYGRSKDQHIYNIFKARFRKPFNHFHLQPPDEWGLIAEKIFNTAGISTKEPFLLVRNTTIRREWSAPERNCRNDYLQKASKIYKKKTGHTVVEIADLEGSKETLDGKHISAADVKLVKGELEHPALVWAFANAAAVIGCHGFVTPLSQLVKANSLIIFGGYERPERFLHEKIDAPRVQYLTPDNEDQKTIADNRIRDSVSLLIENICRT